MNVKKGYRTRSRKISFQTRFHQVYSAQTSKRPNKELDKVDAHAGLFSHLQYAVQRLGIWKKDPKTKNI